MELEGLFNGKKKNRNFQHINNKLDDLYTGVGAKTLVARKNWITTAIDESVEIFKEVSFTSLLYSIFRSLF